MMAKRLNIRFDSDMLESISSEFDLRARACQVFCVS